MTLEDFLNINDDYAIADHPTNSDTLEGVPLVPVLEDTTDTVISQTKLTENVRY